MKPLDRIIKFFREEGAPTNSTASTPGKPGFSSAAPAKGPTAGFDPVMKKMTRIKNTIGLWAGSLKKKKKKGDLVKPYWKDWSESLKLFRTTL